MLDSFCQLHLKLDYDYPFSYQSKLCEIVICFGLIQGKRDKKILKIFFFAEKLKIVSLVDIMEGPCHLDPL